MQNAHAKKKPQKQNPKEHKFSKHTHTQRYTYISVYTYIHIRLSIYKVTCEVHALATHTHKPSSTFSSFFLLKHLARGKKKEQREIEEPKSEPDTQKPKVGYHIKYWVGRKF
jgi:hypothetical protein